MYDAGTPPEQAERHGEKTGKGRPPYSRVCRAAFIFLNPGLLACLIYCFFFSRVCLVGLLGAAALAGALVDMLRRAALASGSPFLAAS